MNLDRDLRDALQPLAGDPTVDAARVLAALPAPVPPGGGPRLPWWYLGIALAVGGALGYGLGRLSEPVAPPPPKASEPELPKAEPKPEPKVEPPRPEPPSPMAMRDMLMLMAFGEMAIDEPGAGVQELKPGGYEARLGSRFTTRQGPAGIYLWANDARVRLDAASVARIDQDVAELEQGRLWVSTVTRPTAFRIEAGLAVVQTEGVELQVERWGESLRLLALAGEAVVRTTAGESVRLAARQQVVVDRSQGLGRPEAIPFVGSVTGWMAPMILQQQDDRELGERIRAMVEAYLEGSHRDAAAVELRRLGGRSVPSLYYALEKVADQPELLHRTAALLGDLASFGQAAWLFLLLETDDPELRSIGFRALVRATGSAVEDEPFWRTAPADRRDERLRAWRERIR